MLKPPKWRRHLAIKVDPLRILRSTGAVCDSHRDAVVVDTLVHQRRRGNGGRPRTPCRSSKPETTPLRPMMSSPPSSTFCLTASAHFIKQWLPFSQDNYQEHSHEPFQVISKVHDLSIPSEWLPQGSQPLTQALIPPPQMVA